MAEAQTSTSGGSTADGSLLEEIMEQTRIKPDEEGYEIARHGVEELLKDLLAKDAESTEKVDKRKVDDMIAALDERLGVQLDEILHNDNFRKLESTWRGLKLLIDRTDFRENIRIHMVSISKEALADDFDDAPDITKSGLYRHVYTAEYGQFGGQPYGLLLGDYEFTPASGDVKLLGNLASVSTMSHAPFVASAGPGFFSIDGYGELPALKDLDSLFEGPRYAKWNSFRQTEDARNVGLAMPRFLARAPYGEDNPVRSFDYQEDVGEDPSAADGYLWGNAAYAFATRVTESFAKYRWCPNIIGPQSGGTVPELPISTFDENGQTSMVGPTEIMLSDRREYELAEQGFIPLTMRKDADNATFFSANSVQKPKMFGNDSEGKQAELNYRLGTQLPYLFIVNRLTHYLKVMQRENLGSWKSRNDLERELNRWIRQYVADQDNPSPQVRSRRPLREAAITVADVAGEAGWYRVEISVTPHFKFMGANFTLALTGKLDAA
ncbi:MAG: type VI secretion system contractile sheath large subunit [Gammaproteobacteria bacterium]